MISGEQWTTTSTRISGVEFLGQGRFDDFRLVGNDIEVIVLSWSLSVEISVWMFGFDVIVLGGMVQCVCPSGLPTEGLFGIS